MWTWSRRAASEIEPLRDGYTMNVPAKPYFLKLGEQDVCRLVSMADVARSSRRPART
jgi:hypothetical protein